MTGIDRRRFLLLAAAAGLTGTRAAPARGSVHRRTSTYEALVRSLRAAPDGRFGHADPRAAHRRYQRWHAAQPQAVRTQADAVLDALEAGGVPGYAELAHAPEGASGGRRCATVTAALALVCVGCEPPLGEDERPVFPTLAPA
jgi:hypothetical protein